MVRFKLQLSLFAATSLFLMLPAAASAGKSSTADSVTIPVAVNGKAAAAQSSWPPMLQAHRTRRQS